MEASPYKIIAVGAVAGPLFGWGTVAMYTGNQRLTVNDLEYFSAPLERAEEVEGRKRSKDLMLWLKGQSSPFKSGVLYPRGYDKSVLASLQPGVIVKVGCERKYIANPGSDRATPTNQSFYYIDTLDVNNQPALTLESSNEAKAFNTQIGKVLMPIMFTGSIALLFVGVNRLQKGKSQSKMVASQPRIAAKSRK
jgi:hypothetical protein